MKANVVLEIGLIEKQSLTIEKFIPHPDKSTVENFIMDIGLKGFVENNIYVPPHRIVYVQWRLKDE